MQLPAFSACHKPNQLLPTASALSSGIPENLLHFQLLKNIFLKSHFSFSPSNLVLNNTSKTSLSFFTDFTANRQSIAQAEDRLKERKK
jgi:hypothetical protein